MRKILLRFSGSWIPLPSKYEGRRARCPKCQMQLRVPPASLIDSYDGREFSHEEIAALEANATVPTTANAPVVNRLDSRAAMFEVEIATALPN